MTQDQYDAEFDRLYDEYDHAVQDGFVGSFDRYLEYKFNWE